MTNFFFFMAMPFLIFVVNFNPISSTSNLRQRFPGQTQPVGYFDPLGFSKSVSFNQLKLFREAELKHGRVAMLATVGFIVQEKFSPLFQGKISGAAIYHFQEIESIYTPFWAILLSSIAVVEGWNIKKGK
jgi:hypothetical protein